LPTSHFFSKLLKSSTIFYNIISLMSRVLLSINTYYLFIYIIYIFFPYISMPLIRLSSINSTSPFYPQ
uniref:Ovule protein n=1 Tax=Strongyloides papillosus TaxID=174720 RepID=A0A0N5CGQ8_STREA